MKAGCPFCGSDASTTWHIGHYDRPWVNECCECQAAGPHAATEQEAVELWNRRAVE